MQKIQTAISRSGSAIHILYRDLLKLYINDSQNFQNPSDIDPEDKKKFRYIEHIDLGPAAQNFIQTSDFKSDDLKKFRESAQIFLIIACTQLKNRCNFSDDG